MITIRIPFTAATSDNTINAHRVARQAQQDAAMDAMSNALDADPNVELELLIDGDGEEPPTFEALLRLSNVFTELRCHAHGKPMSDEARHKYRKSPEKLKEYNDFCKEYSTVIDFGENTQQLKLTLRKITDSDDSHINPEVVKQQNAPRCNR